jgi:colanic acid biosynthesis glycosyl transferase WcaI
VTAERPRILAVVQFFPPETFAGANRIAALMDVLAAHYPLTVATLEPGYPDRRLYSSSSPAKVDGRLPYPVKRCFSFQPHSRSPVLRTLREHFMAIRLALSAAREPADVVFTSSPSMFLGPAVWGLARAKRARFVWDIRDVTWEFAAETQMTSRALRLGTGLLGRYMLATARRADLVIAATPGIGDLLADRGVPAEKLVTVPNVVSRGLLEAFRGCAETVSKPRPVVAYAGLLGYAQGVEVLIDVAGLLPEVDLVVAGDGPELSLLVEKAARLGFGNIRFPGYLAREGILDLYRTADVLFIQVRDTPTLNRTALPSKLGEYMAAGKPVVYAGKGLAARFVEQTGCGVVAAPEDPEAIADAVRALLRDRDRAASLGRNGRAAVERMAETSDGRGGLIPGLEELLERR